MKTYTVAIGFKTLVQDLKQGETVDETLEQELAPPLSIAVLEKQGFLSEVKTEETSKPAPAVVPPAQFSDEK